MKVITDFTSAKFTPGLRNTRKFIVVHHTASGNATINALLRFFSLTKAVSIHYLVAKDGTVHNLVPEDRVAWHAGVSEFQGFSDLNRHSIGIEVESDGVAFTNEQRVAVWELCRAIMFKNRIAPYRVTKHSDVAMPRGRKNDIAKEFWLPWGPRWSDFQSALARKKPFSRLP